MYQQFLRDSMMRDRHAQGGGDGQPSGKKEMKYGKTP
jgi:hypothetical protein